MIKKKIQIGITSPTYNESENVEVFIKGILSLTDTFDINICFVDDDSRDNTIEIIEKYKNKFHKLHIIKREKKKTTQVYSAYHDGLEWLYKNTHSNSFAQIDSDNICDVKTIRRAFNLLQNHPEIDLVKLSKYLNNQIDDREFIRRLLSRIYTITCKLFYDRKITDYSTGIRFYNKNLTKHLINYKKKFTSPIGLLDDLLWTINNKFVIKEIDFKINERKFGNSFFRMGLIFTLGIDFIYCILVHLSKNK